MTSAVCSKETDWPEHKTEKLLYLLIFNVFETGSHYVTFAGLKLIDIYLPLLDEC